MADVTWYFYVVRTVTGALYAGIATDVRRRYAEHASGGRKAARFLRANPPKEIAFRRRIGSRSLALKVEYWFKQLPKRDKEAIVKAGKIYYVEPERERCTEGRKGRQEEEKNRAGRI